MDEMGFSSNFQISSKSSNIKKKYQSPYSFASTYCSKCLQFRQLLPMAISPMPMALIPMPLRSIPLRSKPLMPTPLTSIPLTAMMPMAALALPTVQRSTSARPESALKFHCPQSRRSLAPSFPVQASKHLTTESYGRTGRL